MLGSPPSVEPLHRQPDPIQQAGVAGHRLVQQGRESSLIRRIVGTMTYYKRGAARLSIVIGVRRRTHHRASYT
jgi:hypothetical protein